MTTTPRRGLAVLAVLAVLSGATACGGGDDDTETEIEIAGTAATAATSESTPSESASPAGPATASGQEVDLKVLTVRAPEGATQITRDGTGAAFSAEGVTLSFFSLATPAGDVETVAKALEGSYSSGDPAPTRGPNRTVAGVEGVTLNGPYGGSKGWYIWAASIGDRLVTITFDSFEKGPQFDQMVDSVLASVQAT